MRAKPEPPPEIIRHWRGSPYTCEPGHNAYLAPIGGELVEIDVRIVELVKVMNSIPGVETTSSCRGGRAPGVLGYVSFEGPNAITFMSALAAQVAEQLALDCPRSPLTNRSPFLIEISNRLCFRWWPSIYPAVLKAVIQAAERAAAAK